MPKSVTHNFASRVLESLKKGHLEYVESLKKQLAEKEEELELAVEMITQRDIELKDKDREIAELNIKIKELKTLEKEKFHEYLGRQEVKQLKAKCDEYEKVLSKIHEEGNTRSGKSVESRLAYEVLNKHQEQEK